MGVSGVLHRLIHRLQRVVMFVAPSFCWIEERVLSLLLRAYTRWCELPLLPPTPKLGLGWVGSRDTLQVHPCKLRRAIHGAQGPVNPPTPSLDSWLVAWAEQQATARQSSDSIAIPAFELRPTGRTAVHMHVSVQWSSCSPVRTDSV